METVPAFVAILLPALVGITPISFVTYIENRSGTW